MSSEISADEGEKLCRAKRNILLRMVVGKIYIKNSEIWGNAS